MRKGWERFVACMARPKWRWVMAVAVASDILSFGLDGILGLFSLGLSDMAQICVDLVTAGVMVAMLGFRWTLAVAFYAATDPVAEADKKEIKS